MSGPAVFGTNPYESKSDVVGKVVAVLRGVTDRRELLIEEFQSRAVRHGDVHELMITDERIDVGAVANRVALLVFLEVEQAGVLLRHDQVHIGTTDVGSVLGFNETHMPNHQNICLLGDVRDGATLGIELGAEVRFSRA